MPVNRLDHGLGAVLDRVEVRAADDHREIATRPGPVFCWTTASQPSVSIAPSDSSMRVAASARSDSWSRRTNIVAEFRRGRPAPRRGSRKPVSPSGGTLV